MPNLIGKFKHYGNIFHHGLMTQVVPSMAAGLIVDLFEELHIDVAKITSDVQNNRSLWAEMSPETKKQLAFAAQKVENLDFITPEFLINSIKKDFPGVASLFLNWPEAAEWLKKQIDDLKAGVNGVEL